MGIVKIKDKTFKTSIPEAEILKKVQVVADRINKDYEGRKPVFLAVLNGSFIFAADLMRMITVPSEISFVKYASYEGTSSTGSMKTLMGLNQEHRSLVRIIPVQSVGYDLYLLQNICLWNGGLEGLILDFYYAHSLDDIIFSAKLRKNRETSSIHRLFLVLLH